jgi:UDP-N-acetylmuramoylalanine-D-glutamate ligase
MMELKGKKVAVLGLSDDGLAMVNALSQVGARIGGFGTGTPRLIRAVEQRFQEISCQLTWNRIPEDALTSFDLIIDTPGGGNFISSRDFAKKQGVSVLSDLDLALQFMPAPLIA